ncbi:MAG: hypothetical protein HC828_12565 [Blastochloris sp.]|nr:hypothetical protein [Blastochloris sp.]
MKATSNPDQTIKDVPARLKQRRRRRISEFYLSDGDGYTRIETVLQPLPSCEAGTQP